jgi:hypothetical protein
LLSHIFVAVPMNHRCVPFTCLGENTPSEREAISAVCDAPSIGPELKPRTVGIIPD